MATQHTGPALVVGGGGFKGAYTVGVLKTLYEYWLPEKFAAIYAVSVGVFASTFYAAHQVETMENTWREYVHGSQLVSFWKLLRGGTILDLDYLAEIFQDEKSWLDLQKVYTAAPNILYCLTDRETGRAVYTNAKDRNTNIFDLMTASCALPYVYQKRIIINDRRYIDGSLSDPLPIAKAVADGFRELVVVVNTPRSVNVIRSKHYRAAETLLDRLMVDPEYTVTVVRPSKPLAVQWFTKKQALIFQAISEGEKDARAVFSAAHKS